jgi:hypothetical protein
MSIPPCITIVNPSKSRNTRKGLTMGIIQALAKEHPITTLGTTLCTMWGVETDETTVGGEEQIRVGTHQSRHSVKHYTIDSHEYWSGEAGLGVEFYPVRVVVIGHVH